MLNLAQFLEALKEAECSMSVSKGIVTFEDGDEFNINDPATHIAADAALPAKEAVVLLRQVERWMSGYGTTTQPEMRERIRAFLEENNLQCFEG
jgi:hypothetical protein